MNKLYVIVRNDLSRSQKTLQDRIKSMSLSYRSFREPDTGNDMTALALVGKKNLFRELTLA